MNLDEKIKLLASKSKASVTISINPNKNCDETITDYIDTISGMCIIDNDITDDVKQKMNENRIKRLVSIGIDEDLANDISKAHTPNFM